MTKILVADDNPLSRELIHEILGSPDCQVLEAQDGREALELIESAKPDVVLLDIQMPILDGFSVIRQLRSDPRFAGVLVVALTAYAMRGDKEKALAAGFDSYITKPISPSSLRHHIGQLLGKRRDTRAGGAC